MVATSCSPAFNGSDLVCGSACFRGRSAHPHPTTSRRQQKQAPSAVLDLTLETFDSVAMDPTKHALVEFYAPWCGHCKSLAPVYEELGKVFEAESSVIVAKVRFWCSPKPRPLPSSR